MDDLTGDKREGARSGSAAGQGDLKQIVGRTEDVPRGILLMIAGDCPVRERVGGKQMAGR